MQINVTMPDWLQDEVAALPEVMADPADRMRTVIRFSRLNFERGTGGPFAAALFDNSTNRLVVLGVNRAVPCNCSSAHAEVNTLSLAQQLLGTFDLGGPGMPEHELVVNWRPCAMCFGALIWSGVRSLVIAGSDPEMEEVTGFDEGPMPADWQGELRRRGIRVREGLLRNEALEVFRAFRDSGARVYNGRGSA